MRECVPAINMDSVKVLWILSSVCVCVCVCVCVVAYYVTGD